MSIFDFFRKIEKPVQQESALEQKNKQYLDMRYAEIERLNRAYDFKTIEGIKSIPVPCKEVNGYDSPTGRVEYYLRGMCFSNYWQEGKVDLAIECLKKAQELMYISDMIWKYDDFIKLVSYLHECGRHDEARAEELRIEKHFEKVGMYPKLGPDDFDNYSSYTAWKETIKETEEERLRKKNLRREYYFLQEHYPDICPKSISGYSRMKNSNSKAYQNILCVTCNFENLF